MTVYPATGRTANQLDTLWAVGMLDIPPRRATDVSLPSLADSPTRPGPSHPRFNRSFDAVATLEHNRQLDPDAADQALAHGLRSGLAAIRLDHGDDDVPVKQLTTAA